MTSRFVIPLTDIGSGVKPPDGAKLFFFESDGTTPKDTHTTKAATVSNSNPVIANSKGLFTDSIYITGDYLVTLKDKSLNLIWGLQPINEFVVATDSLFTKNFETVAQVKLNNSLQITDTVVIKERGSARGEIVSGETANELDIIDLPLVGLQWKIIIDDKLTFNMIGASPNETASNNVTAINHALTLSLKCGGEDGTYLINDEINILQDDFHLNTSRRVVFKATVTDKIIIHWSASDGTTGGLTANGDGLADVVGFSISPLDKTQIITRVDQNYNKLDHLLAVNCARGMELQAGPKVSGADSGCWYNEFDSYHGQKCDEGLVLLSPANAASSPNRNKWYNLRVGEQMNTGIRIFAGDSNEFHGGSCEGVNTGTSPLATPTGVIVDSQSANGADNNHNRFIGFQYEACTIDFINHNARTELFASNPSSGFSDWTVDPLIVIGGEDPSGTPQIFPWMKYQGNGQLPGVDNLVAEFTRRVAFLDEATDKGFRWVDYDITTSNTSNIASISNSRSKFMRLGGMVDWHFRIVFQATSATTTITIDVPEDYDDDLYRTSFTELRIPVFTQGLTGESFVTCRFGTSAGQIKISVPTGDWDIAGSNNQIHGVLRYHST